MFTKTLLGNAMGIVWLFRRPVVVAMLFAVFVAAPERVALAKENGPGAAKSKSVLDSVSRIVGKEPTYLHKPRYALVVLGTNADTKMWMVEDGETLYLDKNLNGDLTDDGPPIARKTSEGLCDYKVQRNYAGQGAEAYRVLFAALGVWEGGRSVRALLDAEWNDTDVRGLVSHIRSDSPKTVPVIHFGGPLTPTLLARHGVFALDSKLDSLDISFVNDGSADGARSYLSIEALLEEIVPEVRI